MSPSDMDPKWQELRLVDPSEAKRPAPPRVCGMLYDGARHQLSGEPEAAKSMLALILALEFVRATPRVASDALLLTDVAYIDFESDRENISNTLAELGATSEEATQRIHYFNPTDGPNNGDVYNIVYQLSCGLVIVDSAIGAYDASGLDDERRKEVERLGNLWIRPFWEEGAATLMLDHVVKDEKKRGRWSIGSERKLGQTETKFGVDVITPMSRGTNGLYKLVSGKDRRGYTKRGTTVAELHLSSDPDTHHVTWEFRKPAAVDEAGGWKPTILMARVSEYVIANPSASRSQVVRDVKGHSTEHKRMALDLLLEGGFVTETEGPREARLYTSLKPYSESTPPPRLDPASTPPGGDEHDPASPPDCVHAGGAAGGDDSGDDDPDPASSNGHIDQDEIERLASLAREINKPHKLEDVA